jgi:nucleotide-binding universal stress UspA family protein
MPGQSGLSGWNIGSIAQKIMMRSAKSILLAYRSYITDSVPIYYKRLFIGLDCSTRAEYGLPIALRLAQAYHAQLVLGTVIQKPELVNHFLLADELELATRIANQNYRVARHYLEQLCSQVLLLGIEPQLRLVISNNVASALHDMVELEDPDLVMLVAHGQSGGFRWPYGSRATSFMTIGTTTLLIVQDLARNEIKQTETELFSQ